MASTEIPPRGDAFLLGWTTNFSAQITSAPQEVGLSPADAAELAAALADYRAARSLATAPITRTAGAVAAKNLAKKNLLAVARRLVKIVGACAAVTDEMRVNLGLRIRPVSPPPALPAPSTRPLLAVSPDGVLRIVDQSLAGSRRRPAGALGAIVFAKIAERGEPAPSSVLQAQFAMLATRYRQRLPIPPGNTGKTLHVMARWYNQRGQLGPVSPVASTTIAA